MSSTLRKYSYDISLELGTLNLGVKFPCQVGIIWQTPLKTIQANNKPSLVNSKVILGETLTNNFILDFDTTKNVFIPRPATLKTLLYTEKGVREAGQVDFDLVAGLNARNNDLTGEYPLLKCPDKNAKISFTIKSVLREEIKNVPSMGGLGNGMMPDIVRNQNQVIGQGNMPTTDGFKKKVKINEPSLGAPSYVPVSTPQFGQSTSPPLQIQPQPQSHAPQYSDHYKNQRQALITQNTNTAALLLKAQTDNDHLKKELRKSLSQKQDLYAQIEAYDAEVNNLRAQNQELREMEEMFKETQEELIKTKTQLARIFNAATELAGPALTDRLQAAVGIQEREY